MKQQAWLQGLIVGVRCIGYNRYKFRKEFYYDPRFKDCMRPIPNDLESTFYIFCKIKMGVKCTVMVKRVESANNKENNKVVMNNHKNNKVAFNRGTDHKQLTKREKVLRAEIKLCALTVSRHLSFL